VYRGGRLPAFVLIALFTVLVAGCGGSDGGTTAAEVRLTRAQLIKQGDTICEEADQRRLAGLQPYIEEDPTGRSQSLPEKERVVREVLLPPFQEEAEELAELNPPKADEDELQALVQALESAVERGEKDPASILERGAIVQFGHAEKLGRQYGFERCGRS
jgi:hypothetical protein